MKTNTNILKTVEVIVLALLLGIGVSYISADWVAPVQAPPVSNVPAPINTGRVAQIKDGDLTVNYLQVLGNLAVGSPGIGGKLSAKEICIDGNCRNSWPTSGGGDGLAGRNVTQIVTAQYRGAACALTDATDGKKVYCAGYNSQGQLGINTTKLRMTFTQVETIIGIKKIVANASAFCALEDGGQGRVWCWGYNGYGELGNGNNINQWSPVITGADFIDIAANTGYYDDNGAVFPSFNCGLKSDGTVWCWGYNRTSSGALGNNAFVSSNIPVQVVDAKDVVPLSATTPTTPLTGAVAIRVGGNNMGYACAILSDRTAKCWGSDTRGQLGNGPNVSPERSYTPVARTVKNSTNSGPLQGIIDIQLSDFTDATTCAIVNPAGGSTSGDLYCFGENGQGQVGDGTVVDKYLPIRINTNDTVKKVVFGGYRPSASASVIHTCALLTNGDVQCWGNNANGQLGIGVTGNRLVPQSVSSLSNVLDIAAAQNIASNRGAHTCAIQDITPGDGVSAGEIRCWGWNQVDGPVGDGTLVNKLVPTLTDDPSILATSLFIDGLTSCAKIRDSVSDSSIRCWGYNTYGGLGVGDRSAHPSPIEPN